MLPNSCKKADDTSTTVTDQDGNVYKTVTIGTQVWMAENLKTTKYLNGDPIETTTSATSDISGENTPKYQWVSSGFENNVGTYGRLYTWFVVTDSRKVCPTGFHLPNDVEWATLVTYLGGETVAGGKLKETGTTHWLSLNVGATNETGFTALPSGCRYLDGSFAGVGSYSGWWSITEDDETYALPQFVLYNYGKVFRESFNKKAGISVRCLKD